MISLLLRLEGVKDLTNDFVVDRLYRLIDDTGFHVRQSVREPFYPQGLTFTVILSESHLTVSTWPEKAELQIDLFNCSQNGLHRTMEFLRRSVDMFRPVDYQCILIDRDTMKIIQFNRDGLIESDVLELKGVMPMT